VVGLTYLQSVIKHSGDKGLDGGRGKITFKLFCFFFLLSSSYQWFTVAFSSLPSHPFFSFLYSSDVLATLVSYLVLPGFSNTLCVGSAGTGWHEMTVCDSLLMVPRSLFFASSAFCAAGWISCLSTSSPFYPPSLLTSLLFSCQLLTTFCYFFLFSLYTNVASLRSFSYILLSSAMVPILTLSRSSP